MFHGKVVESSKGSLSLDKAQQFIASEKCGASLFFIGTVRNHNNNKNVTGITYDAFDRLVIKTFKKIYTEGIKKFKLKKAKVFIEHAKGYVTLGKPSIIIAVSCKHRSEAYQLSRYLIEQIHTSKRTCAASKIKYNFELIIKNRSLRGVATKETIPKNSKSK